MSPAVTSAPGPLWYLSRGSGLAALVLLAVVAGLGIAASCRWRTHSLPRFVTTGVHRSLSWTLAAVLAVHIVTASLDSFAGISLVDAVVPFITGYRSLWMGLGSLALDVGAVVLLSSLALRRIGFGTWRTLHRLGYACFPLAVLHGLGTGSDSRSAWAALFAMGLLFGVVALTAWRIIAPWPAQSGVRAAGVLLLGAATLLTAVWAQDGPLSPGWARAAGTPAALLGPAADTGFAELLPAGTDDPVAGSLHSLGGAVTELDLADSRDPDIEVVLQASVGPRGASPGSASLQVRHGPLVVCAATALVGATVQAACGSAALTLRLAGADPGQITGELQVAAGSTARP